MIKVVSRALTNLNRSSTSFTHTSKKSEVFLRRQRECHRATVSGQPDIANCNGLQLADFFEPVPNCHGPADLIAQSVANLEFFEEGTTCTAPREHAGQHQENDLSSGWGVSKPK